MKNKWFRKKEKGLEMRLRYANFICMRMTTYDYTKGLSMVLDSIKGEYYFDPRAYHRALAYHKRTVIIPEAKKIRTKYINDGRMFYGKNFT